MSQTAETDRIERTLELVREGLSDLKSEVAGMRSGLDAVLSRAEISEARVENLRERVSKHEIDTASALSELRTENKRLWWLMSAAMAVATGATATAVATLVTGVG